MKSIVILIALLGLWSRSVAQENLKPDNSQSQYLAAQKKLGKAFSDEFYPRYVLLHQLSEKIFVAKIDSAARAFYALLNNFKPDLLPAYVAAQRFEIKMYFDKILIEYPTHHEIYTNDRPKNYHIIERIIKDNLPLFNQPHLLDSDLTPFIQSFLGYKINEELNKSIYQGLYNKRLYAMWGLLPQYIKNKECRTFHQYRILFDHLTHNGIKHTEELYEEFKKECQDPTLTAKLEQVYQDSRNDLKDHQVMEYKRIGNYGLDIHVFKPNKSDTNAKKPVMVFFHGGSWSEGQPSWHFQACRKYAEKGWIACSVEYRIYGSQGTLPFAAVMDAKSAIRWLKAHGDELHIDTNRIVATGNSAGGHLVLATALANEWNEKSDELKFSPVPSMLLVNSGVYDLTDEKTAWIRKDLTDKNLVKGISPNHLLKKNLPPTLLIHSTVDQNVPYASAQEFVNLSLALGNKVEFKSLAEGGHFIFDHPKYMSTVLRWRKDFLQRFGYPNSSGD